MVGKLTPSGIGMFTGVLVEACLVDEAFDRLFILQTSLFIPFVVLGLKGTLLWGFVLDEFELLFDEEFVLWHPLSVDVFFCINNLISSRLFF